MKHDPFSSVPPNRWSWSTTHYYIQYLITIYGTPVLGDDSLPPGNKIDWSATMQGTRLLVTWSLWAGSSSRANKPIPPVLALPRAQSRHRPHRPRMGQEEKEARALLIPVL
ncbi:hypothetical protein N7509_009333 [Penicillium cosmopolitanum]|uniref:Uncharacterized protein n=1 Tax=Penicillium cosmopolitanum TaxID=1131564 RepID=A0A9W9VP98_9EURO|nr:uncharacterized protein N7509_009333 [Penicillium cosmopolitanum]KAJ5386792.1 hypothetical protein N7509_009333 [Penicillium cosmopolitanum]